MTTTAATTSASPSTSNDSLMQDKNDASEPNIDQSSTSTSSTTLQPQSKQQNHETQPQVTQNYTSTSQQQQPPLPIPIPQSQQSSKQPQQNNNNLQTPPSTQAANTEQKRPMNAFLLFCKRQRSLVRERYPNLENRGITKILGDCWSKLDKEQKSKYTDLARQHKEAFMKANPDFKWCKTPMSSSNNNNNNNNNNSNTNNSNSNSNDCYATNNARHIESSLPSAHIVDIVQSNSRDTLTNNRQSHEAPKPPKKRFLERNNAKVDLVPYIDQDILDRVIENALPEKLNNNPSGINMCKYTNRISTNLTSSLGANPSSYSTTTSSTTSSSSSSSSSNTTSTTTTNSLSTTTSSSSYSNNVDEPVDFSMKWTYNATNQMIINGLVEKMLSGTDNNASSTFKMNGVDSVQSQPGPPLKRENPEDT